MYIEIDDLLEQLQRITMLDYLSLLEGMILWYVVTHVVS